MISVFNNDLELKVLRIATATLVIIPAIAILVLYVSIEEPLFYLANMVRIVFYGGIFLLSFKVKNLDFLIYPLLIGLFISTNISWIKSSYNGLNPLLTLFYLVIVLSIVSKEKRLLVAFLLVINIFGHLVFRFIYSDYPFFQIDAYYYQFFLVIAIIILFPATAFFIHILKKSYELHQEKVFDQNTILEANNEEISIQSDQLEKFNTQVLALNEKLERTVVKRTAQLLRKNQQITQYAYFNAHKVRGPLARVMGLVTLLENDMVDPAELKPLLKQISLEANEMDGIIKDISDQLSFDAFKNGV